MKIEEIILDIVGLGILCLSIYAYFFMGIGFIEGTCIGIAGLSLFIFKTSQIRKFVEKIINNKLGK